MAYEALIERARAALTLPEPDRCREIRKRAGLFQTDIATELGVHPETVARWERGQRRPRGAHLSAYARLLAEIEAA